MTVTVKDFYADWCGPCDQQADIINEIEADLADHEDVEIEKLDVDEHQDEANKYQVRSLPAVVVLSEDGTVVERFNGLTQRDAIEDAINSANATVNVA
ncbi:thioredoxin domain-containing protein [Salinibaculum rarum]|uniref:thioredoxin domain-containing protein n=1 Tax=Salinibaculum rarum TaxID=3058903 RepID=UPI00265F83A7|nr:thioredoxin domain-containing protein [Salinibaculum sp. KK48]